MDFNVYWIKKLDAKLIQRGVTLVQNSVITFFSSENGITACNQKLYTRHYVYTVHSSTNEYIFDACTSCVYVCIRECGRS